MRPESERDAADRGAPSTPPVGSMLSEFGIAAVLVVFCAVVFWLTTRFEQVAVALSQNMPPQYFPRLLLGTILALTAVMLVESYFRPPKARRGLKPMVYYSVAALLVFVLAVKWLGLVVTMVLFGVLFPLLWGERRYGYLLAFAALFPAAVYLLFVRVLEVQFPHGRLLTWLGL